MTALAVAVFTVGLLVGAAGVVLPALPGVPVTGLAALLAAWMVGFERFGWPGVAWVVALTLLAQGVDLLANLLGARVYGARRAGLWGGVIGSLLGLVLLPPWGFLPGALVGAVLFELLAGRAPAEAFRAGVGAFVGTLGGVVAKLCIVVALAFVVIPRLL